MATINTIEDIIRILREDGEARSAIRRELLTEDLLAMPGQLAEMLKTQTAMLEEQKSLRRDTDSLLKTQAAILEEQRSLRQEQRSLRRDTDSLLKTQTAILEEQRSLRRDTDSLLKTQAAILEEQKSLRRDTNAIMDTLAAVVRELGELRSDLNVHSKDIGDLKGIGLETKLYNRGPSYLATLLSVYDIERVRVAERDDNSREFNANIREALLSGAITAAEYDRILRTDMIVSASKMGVSNPIYAAIEATFSVTRSDIIKVMETARILGKMFPDSEVHSVLYFMNIMGFVKDEAVEHGIHLVEVRNLE